MPGSSVTIVVDGELSWVVAVPESLPAQAREASPDGLAALAGRLADELEASLAEPFLERVVERMAQAIAESGAELPPLPFIGEPFGGREGTD